MAESIPDTRASLLVRLPNSEDAEAWTELVELYGPLIFGIARRKGLSGEDAEDLVQEVFTSVARSIENWLERRDRGSFRQWLFAISRNTALNFLTRPKHRHWAVGGSDHCQLLDEVECPQSDVDEFDLEYRRERFRWAAERVRRVSSVNTWRSFWLTTMEGWSVDAVAEELAVSSGSVYIARSRTMKRLRDLVHETLDDGKGEQE